MKLVLLSFCAVILLFSAIAILTLLASLCTGRTRRMILALLPKHGLLGIAITLLLLQSDQAMARSPIAFEPVYSELVLASPYGNFADERPDDFTVVYRKLSKKTYPVEEETGRVEPARMIFVYNNSLVLVEDGKRIVEPIKRLKSTDRLLHLIRNPNIIVRADLLSRESWVTTHSSAVVLDEAEGYQDVDLFELCTSQNRETGKNYQRTIDQLLQQKVQAEERGDAVLADSLQAGIDALKSEISKVQFPDGNPREDRGSPRKNCRNAVQGSLSYGLDKIKDSGAIGFHRHLVLSLDCDGFVATYRPHGNPITVVMIDRPCPY